MTSKNRQTSPRGTECKRCGEVHKGCAAHNRAGKACGQSPQANQDVCHLHGGRSPRALVEAAAVALEDQARTVVATRWQANGSAPVEDPLTELARLAGEIVAWKDYLRDQTQGLDGLLAYWVDREFVGPAGEVLRSEATEQLRAIVVAYERSQDRSARVLADLVKLDIAGRMADIKEQQAALIVSCVRLALAGQAWLSPEQRVVVSSAIADQLDTIRPSDPVIPAELYP